MDEHDQQHLRAVIERAAQGIEQGHGPFAARLVIDGEVIAEACNRVVLDHDPTAHAEIQVLREAARKLGNHRLDGATLYASCEPCPMCFSAAHWARIKRVVYAADKGAAAAAGFDDLLILQELCNTAPQQTLPMEQGLKGDGAKVFDIWMEYPDREEY